MTTTTEAPTSANILPDGSAFFTASLPPPAGHWLTAPDCDEWDVERDTRADTPAPLLTHASRDAVIAAMRWAIRGATIRGYDMEFDPDALVQNAVYALCGPYGTACLIESAASASVECGPADDLLSPGQTGHYGPLGNVIADEPAALKLGTICERLSFTVSADFMVTLGYRPVFEKGARLFHESDFANICQAISAHVLAVAHQHAGVTS